MWPNVLTFLERLAKLGLAHRTQKCVTQHRNIIIVIIKLLSHYNPNHWSVRNTNILLTFYSQGNGCFNNIILVLCHTRDVGVVIIFSKREDKHIVTIEMVISKNPGLSISFCPFPVNMCSARAWFMNPTSEHDILSLCHSQRSNRNSRFFS